MAQQAVQSNIKALDLTKEFPRSPAKLLGDYVVLARTIDKCRATLAGKAGEYHWNCPVAHLLFDFKGIRPEDFEQQVAAGKTDEEILAWVEKTGKQRSREEILAWSYDCKWYAPQEVEKKAYLEQTVREPAPNHPYVYSFFQMLDLEENRLEQDQVRW